MMSAPVRRLATVLLAVAAAAGVLARRRRRRDAAAARSSSREGWEFARAADGPVEARRRSRTSSTARPTSELFDGHDRLVPAALPGPAHARGLGLGAALRRRAPARRGLPQRPPHRRATPTRTRRSRCPRRACCPGSENMLTVRVDNRRTPRLPRGLVELGRDHARASRSSRAGASALRDIGAAAAEVDCAGRLPRVGRSSTAGSTNRATAPRAPARRACACRPPGGGPATAADRPRCARSRPGETRARAVPRPGRRASRSCGRPSSPQLYDARRSQARRRRARRGRRSSERVGLRTVRVRDGHLWLNGRRLDAARRVDPGGHARPRPGADRRRHRADRRATSRRVGANVTRAHYLLDERLLDRLDEEGILVWSQAPVYHRDVQLRTAGRPRARARRACAARCSRRAATRRSSRTRSPTSCRRSPTTTRRRGDFLDARRASSPSDLDPTRAGLGRHPRAGRASRARRPTRAFDLLGINSYFGWYQGDAQHATGDLADLEPFLRRDARAVPATRRS